MDCYTENVVKSIDRNLRYVRYADKQAFLDAVIAHATKRRTTEPRRSSETRHGSGRSK